MITLSEKLKINKNFKPIQSIDDVDEIVDKNIRENTKDYIMREINKDDQIKGILVSVYKTIWGSFRRAYVVDICQAFINFVKDYLEKTNTTAKNVYIWPYSKLDIDWEKYVDDKDVEEFEIPGGKFALLQIFGTDKYIVAIIVQPTLVSNIAILLEQN